MPQTHTLIYDSTTGAPVWMWSVDVTEAMRLGDYSWTPIEGLEPTAEAIADALARARGVNVPL
jgi:hypothetical protein